jgi:hypothetical protein
VRPTINQVLNEARAFLGDDDVPGGSDFVNTTLEPHLQAAYNDLFRIFNNEQVPKTQTECFYAMAAYQTTLDPVQAGITDLGSTIGMEERGSVTTLNVTNATPGANGCTLQVNNHGLTTGAVVSVNGITGLTPDVNNIFGISVVDANDILLLGCTATGTYVSGGTISTSTEEFLPMQYVDRIDWTQPVPGPQLNVYSIEGVNFKFYPANNIRQLRIIYELSGDLNVSNVNAVIQVDDCQDYLALQTAYRQARARDLSIADELKADASWVAQAMTNFQVRSLQGQRIRMPAFRPRRSVFALY